MNARIAHKLVRRPRWVGTALSDRRRSAISARIVLRRPKDLDAYHAAAAILGVLYDVAAPDYLLDEWGVSVKKPRALCVRRRTHWPDGSLRSGSDEEIPF